MRAMVVAAVVGLVGCGVPVDEGMTGDAGGQALVTDSGSDAGSIDVSDGGSCRMQDAADGGIYIPSCGAGLYCDCHEFNCVNPICVPLIGVGDPCQFDDQCSSGSCSNGHC